MIEIDRRMIKMDTGMNEVDGRLIWIDGLVR